MSATIPSEVYTSMGLTHGEFKQIVEIVGREPSHTELGMFSVMWSEHCGYKYSRPILAYFKQYKEALEGAGLENAGVVDIGDGLGITMKVESHNHPSAVEPYQGAATGVGGIIRDILTMGARPIASLNSLRFGTLTEGVESKDITTRNRYLFEHVVAGIAGYGNCVGVPTVAGEVNFHPRYSGNPLVNAMCVGVLNLSDLTTAGASGAGNPVIYLGSATGKDGIQGASFASEALGADNEDKRPNVQIGDPFSEKQLIEATLEALQTGAVVAIQDMGAAGLTCSTVEMASKGGVGMTVDLDLVPMRENDMTAFELMLSESQERMLAVAHIGREQEVIDIFVKWGLKAVVIGHVTDEERLIVTRFGEVVCDIHPHALTDTCPTYTTPIKVPAEFEQRAKWNPASLPTVSPREALLKLLAYPDIASKRWVYRQYDQQVQTQTAILCGAGDASVLALRGTKKGIALKIDGNARQTMAHPFRGGQLAVVEACRNVACTGAKPVALTDGLNFGNPQYGHVYWQFERAVKGIAESAETMGTPVISGNVSFYNESDLGEVLPTPLIGCLGILDNAEARIGISPGEDCDLYLVEVPVEWEQEGLGASAFAEILGSEDGYPIAPDVEGERKLCHLLFELAHNGVALSAHDLSEGGLAVALSEIALLGKRVEAQIGEANNSILFGEAPGRVLIGSNNGSQLAKAASDAGLICRQIGRVSTGSGLAIEEINLSFDELKTAYESLESLLA